MTNIIDLSKFQKTKVNQEDGNLIDDPDYDLGSGWMVLDFRTQLHFLRNVQANVMQSQFVEQATQAVEVGSLLSVAEVLLGDIHPFFGFQKVTIQNNSHSEQDMVVSLRQYDTGEVIVQHLLDKNIVSSLRYFDETGKVTKVINVTLS